LDRLYNRKITKQLRMNIKKTIKLDYYQIVGFLIGFFTSYLIANFLGNFSSSVFFVLIIVAVRYLIKNDITTIFAPFFCAYLLLYGIVAFTIGFIFEYNDMKVPGVTISTTQLVIKCSVFTLFFAFASSINRLNEEDNKFWRFTARFLAGFNKFKFLFGLILLACVFIYSDALYGGTMLLFILIFFRVTYTSRFQLKAYLKEIITKVAKIGFIEGEEKSPRVPPEIEVGGIDMITE